MGQEDRDDGLGAEEDGFDVDGEDAVEFVGCDFERWLVRNC